MLYKFEYLYSKMKENILSLNDLDICGYPLFNQWHFVSFNKPSFFESSDENSLRCRCQKTVNLADKFWYMTENCWYHPLKLDENRKYLCCYRRKGAVGCTFYPTHVCSHVNYSGETYFKAQNRSINLHNTSNIFALDCEFIYTTIGMEVARVSLVSPYKGVVFDKYVCPTNGILDFNTRFSGIMPEHLSQSNVKSLSEVQYDLLHYFLNSDSIIVGHALHSDLKALGIVHDKIIDTSILFPHFKGFPWRHSLKYLAKTYLNINIHDGEFGHDSVTDAKVSLLLALSKFNFLASDIIETLKL